MLSTVQRNFPGKGHVDCEKQSCRFIVSEQPCLEANTTKDKAFLSSKYNSFLAINKNNDNGTVIQRKLTGGGVIFRDVEGLLNRTSYIPLASTFMAFGRGLLAIVQIIYAIAITAMLFLGLKHLFKDEFSLMEKENIKVSLKYLGHALANILRTAFEITPIAGNIFCHLYDKYEYRLEY